MTPNFIKTSLAVFACACTGSLVAAPGIGGVQGSGGGAPNVQNVQAPAAAPAAPMAPPPMARAPVSVPQVSSVQVTGAQFSAARVGVGHTTSNGNLVVGAPAASAPVQQTPQGSAYPAAHTSGNGPGFGTENHARHEGDPNRGTGAGTGVPSSAGRDGRFTSSNRNAIQPPVALDPSPQTPASRSIAANNTGGNGRNLVVGAPAASFPGRQFHGPGFNPSTGGSGINTANHPLTKPGQWRHDPGHPHHHRHFVSLNNSIYLLDGGIYDSPPDFSQNADASYTYEDGYYDTFDPSVVSAVQRRLGDEGYFNGVIDGQFKTDLRDAIVKYQQDHGLPVTGTLDESLLKELGLL